MFNMTSRRKSERRAARLGMQRGLSTPLPAWDQTLSDLPIDKQYEYMREVKGYSHEEAVREIMQRSGLPGSRIDVAVARVQDRIQRQIGNVRDTADPRSASGYSKHVVDHLVRMGVKKPEARKRVVWYRGEIVGKWLPMGVSAENAAERLRERMRVYGRGSAAAGYAVKDGNRVVARARSKVAAHRTTRAKKHAGSRVVMTTKMTTVERRTVNRSLGLASHAEEFVVRVRPPEYWLSDARPVEIVMQLRVDDPSATKKILKAVADRLGDKWRAYVDGGVAVNRVGGELFDNFVIDQKLNSIELARYQSPRQPSREWAGYTTKGALNRAGSLNRAGLSQSAKRSAMVRGTFADYEAQARGRQPQPTLVTGRRHTIAMTPGETVVMERPNFAGSSRSVAMRAPSVESLMKAFPKMTREEAKLIRLVAKADDADSLEKVIDKFFPKTRAYIFSLMSSPYDSKIWRVTVQLHAIDEVMGTYGVEGLGPGRSGDYAPPYEYLNAGDTYATTLIYHRSADNLFIGDWGSIAEKHPSW